MLPGLLLDRWHLLSLDAPTVAFVWSYALARSANVQLPILGPVMLAIATWLLYVADRLLDSMQPSHAALLKDRHLFHALHCRSLLLFSIPSIAALLWFIVARMDPAPRREDFFIAGSALVYLFFVHLPFSPAKSEPFRLPKELFVGIIFAAACVVPAWSRQPTARPSLLILSTLFAGLCWLNCVAIEQWESPDKDAPDSRHGSTLWMGRHLTSLCIFLGSSACAAAVLFVARGAVSNCAYAFCIGCSSLLLACLHRHRSTLNALRLRAAADFALLTPAPILLAALLLREAHLHLS